MVESGGVAWDGMHAARQASVAQAETQNGLWWRIAGYAGVWWPQAAIIIPVLYSILAESVNDARSRLSSIILRIKPSEQIEDLRSNHLFWTMGMCRLLFHERNMCQDLPMHGRHSWPHPVVHHRSSRTVGVTSDPRIRHYLYSHRHV